MATESPADSELSVTLPPAVSEWLDERAKTLGIEREALLVQLLETHKSATELDEADLSSLFESAEAGGSAIEDVDGRIEDVDSRIEDVDGRIDDIDAKLAKNVEDIRERVIQLRDAVEDRAPADHSHEELRTLSEDLETAVARLDELGERTGDLDETLRQLSDDVDSTNDRLGTTEDKLDRLARAVVAGRRREDADSASSAELDGIRQTANRNGTAEADCAGCGESVRIGLLSEAACPHCERRFHGLDTPSSVRRWFKRPTLVIADADEGGSTEQPGDDGATVPPDEGGFDEPSEGDDPVEPSADGDLAALSADDDSVIPSADGDSEPSSTDGDGDSPTPLLEDDNE